MVFLIDIKRNFLRGRLIMAGFLVLLFCIASSFVWIVVMLRSGLQEIVVTFDDAMIVQPVMLPVTLSVAAAFPVFSFCQDWKNGYWKPILFRAGKHAYLQQKPMAVFLQSAVVVMLGMTAYVIFLLICGSFSGAPLEYPNGETTCLIPGHPFIYFTLCILTQAVAAGFWSMLSMLLASWQMDVFLAVAAPLSIYVLLKYFLQITIGFNLTYTATLRLIPDAPYASAVLGILFFLILSMICAQGVRYLIERRIENEHFA